MLYVFSEVVSLKTYINKQHAIEISLPWKNQVAKLRFSHFVPLG